MKVESGLIDYKQTCSNRHRLMRQIERTVFFYFCLFVFCFFPMTINKELNTKARPSVGIAANITAHMNKEAGSVLHFVRLSIKCCGLEQLTASVVLLL